MGFYEELDDVTAEAVDMFGRGAGGAPMTLSWNGLTIQCMEEDETTKQELVIGGLIDDTDTVVRARKELFKGELPERNDPVTLNVPGRPVKNLKAWTCVTSHGDPEVRVALRGPHQRC